MSNKSILDNLKETPPRALNDHILVIDAMNMLIRSFSLLKAMKDKDSAVRYWGVTGIGNIGKKAGAEAMAEARKAMKDNSPSVRIGAARAVARLGAPDMAIPVLVSELKSEHQWGRLAAAIVLDEMDAQARPALDALQQAVKQRQPNKYIVRVANRAVNDLLGTENRVP